MNPFIIVALLLTLTLITACVIFLARPKINTQCDEKKEEQKEVVSRKDFYLKIKTLGRDEHQIWVIQSVTSYIDNEAYLEIKNIQDRLTYLAQNGVQGHEFQELFIYLHQSLLQKGLLGEAEYLERACL